MFKYKIRSNVTSTIVIAAGTFIGQVVVFLSSPLITRFYKPEDFGIFSIYLSVISTIGTIANLKYSFAIPLPKNDKDGVNLFYLSVINSLLISLVILALCILFQENVLNAFDIEYIKNSEVYIFIGVFIIGVVESLNYLAVRMENFKRIAMSKLNQGISYSAIQLGYGFFWSGPVGLLLGDVVARMVSAITLYTKKINTGNLDISSIKDVAYEYRNFPKYSSLSGFLNGFGLELPIFIIAALYGEKNVGIFTFSLKIIGLPVTLLGKSLSQVYISKASKIRDNMQELRRSYLSISYKLAIIGVFVTIAIYFAVNNAFLLIFDENWVQSITVINTLLIMFYFQFIVIPLSHTLYILEKNRIQLFWDISKILAVVMSIFIPYKLQFGFTTSLYVYAFVSALMYIILYILCLININHEKK